MTLLEQSIVAPPIKSKTAAVKNVLFATDFSATSDAAFPYATAICRHFGSTLHVVHVISDTSLLLMTGGVDYVSMGTIYEDALSDAKAKIEQITAHLDDLPHRSYVRHGQVWKGLEAVIADNAIDLIVLGTHGRTGLGKLLLGSVAEDILRHATCPVLTIGPAVTGRAKLPAFAVTKRDLAPIELAIHQILFATNFAEDAPTIARGAVQLAEEFGARLTLMHVVEGYEDLGARPGPIEDGVQKLRDLVPKDAGLHYPPETVMEFGNPAKLILKVAAERESDLIVLGAKPAEDRAGSTHVPWTTAHQVIAHAACPVMTVRE